MLINCLKCYRLHKCGEGLYYCPFFTVNPCTRGKHFIPAYAAIKKHKEPVKAKPIPAYKPPIRKPNFIDWQRYHTEIFVRYYNGEAIPDIARTIGVTEANVRRYIERY